jgi:hypothetical protein
MQGTGTTILQGRSFLISVVLNFWLSGRFGHFGHSRPDCLLSVVYYSGNGLLILFYLAEIDVPFKMAAK